MARMPSRGPRGRGRTRGPAAWGSPGRGPHDEADVAARLDRLERLVRAIAAHLGIEGPEVAQSPPRRGGVRDAEPHRDAGARDVHAVVRTVARKLSGRLRRYNPERGYGFVVSPDAPDDVFFHRSDCRIDPGTLDPAASVTFDLVEMVNGQYKAVNVAPRT